jgi:hypothetical protein
VKISSLGLATLVFILSLTSCKKINEATELGGDLIPPIDNVTTFDTTLSVDAYNFLFNSTQDSTATGGISYLGNINNDPLFGKSEGRMYFDLMPAAIKSPFPFKKDSLIGLDSVVLVMGYNSLYGDSTKAQQVQVLEIPTSQTFSFLQDYKINTNPINTLGTALSPIKTFIPSTLNDSVFPRDEKAANQLRIPLNNSFGQRLLNYDTLNAYASRAAFKTYFNGFAVVPQNNGTANALVGFNIASTKLSFYVRYKNSGKIDTATVNFTLGNLADGTLENDTIAVANYISRDYSGSELATAVTGTTPDNLIYIQNSPGSYAKLLIPGLSGLTNRIVHLAQLTVEQVKDPLADIFTPPAYLYLDAFDAGKNRFRTIPYDVQLSATGSLDLDLKGTADSTAFTFANPEQFGMIGIKRKGSTGDSVYNWQFNLTRYVQHIANGTEPAQELRLYSPFPRIRALSNNIEQFISTGTNYGAGRVRLGGGNHPTQRMRMRLVYSKL